MVKKRALNEPPNDSGRPISCNVFDIPAANTLAGPAIRVKSWSGLNEPAEMPNVAAKMIMITTSIVSENIAPVVIGIACGSFSTWRDVEKVDTNACQPDIAPLDSVTNSSGHIGPRFGW